MSPVRGMKTPDARAMPMASTPAVHVNTDPLFPVYLALLVAGFLLMQLPL